MLYPIDLAATHARMATTPGIVITPHTLPDRHQRQISYNKTPVYIDIGYQYNVLAMLRSLPLIQDYVCEYFTLL